MPQLGLMPANQTREMVTAKVQEAVIAGTDGTIMRSEWRTAVCFLTNRVRDGTLAVQGLQEMLKVRSKEARQESLI